MSARGACVSRKRFGMNLGGVFVAEKWLATALCLSKHTALFRDGCFVRVEFFLENDAGVAKWQTHGT